MTEELIIPKLNGLSENLKIEVLHFVEFLQTKNQNLEPKIEQEPKRKFGYAKGKYKISPDFEEPLDDFKDYI